MKLLNNVFFKNIICYKVRSDSKLWICVSQHDPVINLKQINMNLVEYKVSFKAKIKPQKLISFKIFNSLFCSRSTKNCGGQI